MSKNNNNLMIGVVVVIVVLLFFGFGYRGYGMMTQYNPGFMLLSWVLNIALIILVVLGILWLIKNIDYIKRRIT